MNNYQKLLDRTQEEKAIYRPEILRLQNKEDKARFTHLIDNEAVYVYDELYDQLKEMLKSRHPKRMLNADDYKQLIAAHLNETPADEYGVWVYYPWSKRMLHLLDEDEFIEVRTSRNQYKITNAERATLASKKVGIIGLSVGQSVAVTMAMERSFGELRLADFDVLELTNLNRIRTGLYNLGIKKVIAVAREIAEIDPYLKTIIFDDGLTEQNMDDFFLGGGKLDMLIDECDGVDIKILCRLKAKSLQVPVLMEASDRGTIDVERFDLEPNRSILHGLIDHLDVTKLKDLKTNEERIPYLAPMVGVDTMSVRLKASAVEVGQSITTWPQLASAVVLGGGAVADIWRRIALDQYNESGRYFVDMDELVGNAKKPPVPEVNPYDALTNEEALQITATYKADTSHTIALSSEAVEAILSAAITAPTGGNSQPWKWVSKNGCLFLLHDKHYSYSFMDFKDTASYIGLGAAIENAVLEAHKQGLEVKVENFPVADKRLVAVLSFSKEASAGVAPHDADQLAAQIYKRQTNRKVTTKDKLADKDLEALKQVVQLKDAELTFFEDVDTLKDLGQIASATDKFRLLYPQSHFDFIHNEMRWDTPEAETKRTGMDINTLELRPSELIGAKLIRQPEVVSFLRHIGGGDVFKGPSEKAFMASYAMGLLTVPQFTDAAFVDAGRALERIWLKATELGLAFHMVNVPFAYFLRHKHDKADLPVETVNDIAYLYDRFRKTTGLAEGREEVALFRIFKAEATTDVPLRRYVKDVLVHG